MKLSRLIFCAVLVLAVANTCLWFAFSVFQGEKRVVDDTVIIVGKPPMGPLDIAIQLQKQGFDFSMFSGLSSPSLEMKENVDFFLTPALLVQECISENVIITYPGE